MKWCLFTNKRHSFPSFLWKPYKSFVQYLNCTTWYCTTILFSDIRWKKEMYVHIYVYIQSGPELALQFKLFVLFCTKIETRWNLHYTYIHIHIKKEITFVLLLVPGLHHWPFLTTWLHFAAPNTSTAIPYFNVYTSIINRKEGRKERKMFLVCM